MAISKILIVCCWLFVVFSFFPLQGFIRVFNDMTDIVLDAPNAYHTLSKFVDKGMEAGFVTQMIAEQVPNRYVNL